MLEEAQRIHEEEKAKLPDFELRSYIERVGDCTGVNPHAAAEAKHQTTPSLEDYIKLSRLAYPGIFPTRARVLDQIFLTIGNGLDWRDGALFSVGERHESARERLEAGEEITWDLNESPVSFYPMSDNYSGVFTVPDDVRHDWLAGAFEILRLVLESDPDYSTAHHSNADNIKKAKEAYNRLYERFQSNPAYHPVFCWLQSRLTYPEVVESNLKAGWKPESRDDARARAKALAKEREKERALAAAKKKKKATKKRAKKKKAKKKKAKKKAKKAKKKKAKKQ
jgi:hypothetical protein